ncbi:hypothetical protein MASR1M32_16400 [Rhodobacter sp.]
MPKYLNEAHAEFLDLLQTKSVGWKVHFFRYENSEVETSIAAAANRINFAVRDCVGRISKLASDVTKTVPMQHEASRQIYDRLAEHVAKDIAHIRTKADADATAARDRAFGPLAADPSKAALYGEIRAYCTSRRTDPAFPAELSKMVRENRDVAAALNSAPGFLAGISEDRRMGLVMDAVAHLSPDDAAAMVHATDVGKEADKIEAGMRKLKIACYDTAQSNKARETFVDAAAPFAEAPAAE